MLAGFWDILAKRLLKYLTELGHPNPGGAYIHLWPNPVLNIMVYLDHRWYELIMKPEFNTGIGKREEVFRRMFRRGTTIGRKNQK